MRVEELAMVMNLAREIRILPWGGLEHNLWEQTRLEWFCLLGRRRGE